jgi:hypothetical protein
MENCMRKMLAGIITLSAVILCVGPGVPAVAGEQFSAPDYRSNFVYRFWGARHTYRFTRYDGHHTLTLGPRNHFRLRWQGIDFRRDDPWEPRVEVHREGLK